jgi:hypothetical protein
MANHKVINGVTAGWTGQHCFDKQDPNLIFAQDKTLHLLISDRKNETNNTSFCSKPDFYGLR